jgi:hypothetical protein
MAATLGAADDLSVVIAKRARELIRALPEIDPAKVFFARAYEIDPNEMPCVDIEIGPDQPMDPDGQSNSYWTHSELILYVDLYHQSNGAKAMEVIARQRALAHHALLSDYRLGFGETGPVTMARYGGSAEPASDDESGLPGWTMRVIFPVQYRFNVDDRTVYTAG